MQTKKQNNITMKTRIIILLGLVITIVSNYFELSPFDLRYWTVIAPSFIVANIAVQLILENKTETR